MKPLLILITCFGLVSGNIKTTMAQSTLAIGDIAIIGLNSDGDDEFSFLLLKDISAGTSIYATDKGWNDGTGFYTIAGDGIWQWSTATALSAGTTVHIKTTNNGIIEAGSLVATPGTVTWVENNSTSISYAGDQIFLYQGTAASPTFITGCSWNVESYSTSANWDGSCAAAQTSALPDQLETGTNAIWLYGSGPTEYDNFRYDCSVLTTGTPSALSTSINNISNWNVDLTGSTAYTLNPFPCSFSIVTPTAPTVTTSSASSITSTSATLGGNVTADGGATVDENGIVYSTTDDTPTIAEGATRISISSGTGEFSQLVGLLSSNTTYYFNAYAHNSEGYSYGTAGSFTTNPEATIPSGTGTSGDPYLISNLAELYWVAEQTNGLTVGSVAFSGKYFKQTADIDASPTATWFPDGSGGYYGWTPIGYMNGSNYVDFGGNYDGQNHTISGLYINRTNTDEIGLFGGNNGGSVTNLGVINVSITGKQYAGIFGYIYGGCSITNCYSTGTITATISSVGGLIGIDDGSTSGNNSISQCYSTCTVSAWDYVGGLIGNSSGTDRTITDCYAIGSVTATGTNVNSVGGLIGYIDKGTVTKCYATGNVSCVSGSAGGFIGTNWSTVNNCFASGNVAGLNYVGGFFGTTGGTTISNCYSSGSVSESGTIVYYAGGFAGANTGTITKCYTVSSISGTIDPAKKGSFAGINNTGTINNDCFWNADIYTTGYAFNSGTFSASGKTTVEMQTASTFTDAGWDFTGETTNGTDDYWGMDASVNNGYPIFVSQLPGTFTGTVSNDWATAENWAGGSVPTAGTDVTIPTGKTAEIAPGTSANCNNITIDAAGSLTIKSDATNAGSLIVSGTATGNVTYQSYLAETGKWHVVTAPVAGQNVWGFATLAGNSIAEKTGKRAVTEYIEATNTWNTNYPTADTEGSFAAGSGYSVLRSDAGVVSYTGTINTSDVSKPITRSLYGWNALGNPYTSAINATGTAHATNNLITANTDKLDPVFAALYVWDAVSSQYVTINNTGTGTLVQNYIQAGQGFFVRAKDNSGLNFSITEAMQTHQPATPLKSAENTWPTILLTAKSNNKLSSTMVTFNSQMTNGLDVTYDAGMFKADKDFALYSKLVDDNGNDFAIQALPEKFEGLIIPLGIDAPAGTEISFSAGTFNLSAEATVYLEDRASNQFTKLDATEAVYTVTITEQTKGAGNFYLHTSAATTGIEDQENDIQVYTRDRAIFVNGNLDAKDVVTVFGVDGKLYYKKNAGQTGLLRIDATKIPAGIYLISIGQSGGRVTHKVILGE